MADFSNDFIGLNPSTSAIGISSRPVNKRGTDAILNSSQFLSSEIDSVEAVLNNVDSVEGSPEKGAAKAVEGEHQMMTSPVRRSRNNSPEKNNPFAQEMGAFDLQTSNSITQEVDERLQNSPLKFADQNALAQNVNKTSPPKKNAFAPESTSNPMGHGMSLTEDTEKPNFSSFGFEGTHDSLRKDASSKSLTSFQRKSSFIAKRKQSITRAIREFQVKRRSERFYRFLHHELAVMITFWGSLSILFHMLYSLLREEHMFKSLQPFVDGVLRLSWSVFLCLQIVTKPPRLWHCGLYLWVALNLFANDFVEPTAKAFTVMVGVVCILLLTSISLRELRFYCECPALYRAFTKHCSTIDGRGRILFYKRVRPALLDAGVSTVIQLKHINLLIDGLQLFEKPMDHSDTIPEEVTLQFDQFVMLHDAYGKMVEDGKFAAEDGAPKIAKVPTEMSNSNLNLIEDSNPSPDIRGAMGRDTARMSLGEEARKISVSAEVGDKLKTVHRGNIGQLRGNMSGDFQTQPIIPSSQAHIQNNASFQTVQQGNSFQQNTLGVDDILIHDSDDLDEESR